MINRKEYSYELIEKNEIINRLKWSMAGGGVRILTKIDNPSGSDKLMKQFIEDCKEEDRTILPLSIIGQEYFEKHLGEVGILKSLDVAFIKEQWH